MTRLRFNPKKSASVPPPKPKKEKLTYAEKIELEGILDTIAAAEAKVAAIEKALEDPTQYARAKELEPAKAEVARLIERWELLESKR